MLEMVINFRLEEVLSRVVVREGWRFGQEPQTPILAMLVWLGYINLMLAAFNFATYVTAVHPLAPGDRLLLYTDGLLEAANAHGEEFGPHRLSQLLKQSAQRNAEDAADHIVSSLRSWARAQNDDLTVLICDYTGQTIQVV